MNTNQINLIIDYLFMTPHLLTKSCKLNRANERVVGL